MTHYKKLKKKKKKKAINFNFFESLSLLCAPTHHICVLVWDAVSCRKASSSANLGTHCKSTSKWPDTNHRVFFSWVVENQAILIWTVKTANELSFFLVVYFYHKDGNFGKI
jgi:hypothetical protein